MRALLAILLLAMLAAQIIVANDLHTAANAMQKASDDYRDAYREYLQEKIRIASMLEQLQKDTIRLRQAAVKKGG